MKSYLFLILILVRSSNLVFADPATEPSCRTFVYSGLDLKASAEKDLLANNWEYFDIQTSQNFHLYFREYGVLDIVEETRGAISYNSCTWSLEQNGSTLNLLLFDMKGKPVTQFEIIPNCMGIFLLDRSHNSRIHLSPNANSDLSQAPEEVLTGTWVAAEYPFSLTNDLQQCGTFETIHGAFARFEFKKDGKYSFQYGNPGMQFTEYGYWELTPDNQYLILTQYQKGESTHRLIKINEMMTAKLDLCQTVPQRDPIFCLDNHSKIYKRIF